MTRPASDKYQRFQDWLLENGACFDQVSVLGFCLGVSSWGENEPVAPVHSISTHGNFMNAAVFVWGSVTQSSFLETTTHILLTRCPALRLLDFSVVGASRVRRPIEPDHRTGRKERRNFIRRLRNERSTRNLHDPAQYSLCFHTQTLLDHRGNGTGHTDRPSHR